MSREFRRLSMCQGKAPLTWVQAKAILDRMTEKTKGRKRETYHCEFCRAWHIGRPKKMQRGKPKHMEADE